MAEKMKFFDVKTKQHFEADTFEIRVKKGRPFAVTKSPEGTHECWKVVSKDAAAKFKEEGIPYKEIKD